MIVIGRGRVVVRLIAAALVWTSFAGAASAALIVRDYRAASDGLLTYDSRTGLELIDFSQTVGVRSSDALVQNPGFRIANRIEVESLLTSFGFIDIGSGASLLDNLESARQFVSLVGSTSSFFDGLVYHSWGRVLNADNRVDLYMVRLRDRNVGGIGGATEFAVTNNDLRTSSSSEATFLIRDATTPAIPEPSVWAQLITGFGLVGAAMRRPAFRLRRAGADG